MNKQSPTGIEDPPGTNSVTTTLPKFSCVQGCKGGFGFGSCNDSVMCGNRKTTQGVISITIILNMNNIGIRVRIKIVRCYHKNLNDCVPHESRKSNPDLRHHRRGFWAIGASSNDTRTIGQWQCYCQSWYELQGTSRFFQSLQSKQSFLVFKSSSWMHAAPEKLQTNKN